ncbi:ABC transporter ATP-binding protein [Clostridium polynesiense]|uniref:ABC transporter ATP-binding protein n=1 Tax=Clostridium polynesiense TaxID=1325933 RepID=UPI00058DF071|nr:ABC transporter ATP-binding protein [Clostridium polynesiense]
MALLEIRDLNVTYKTNEKNVYAVQHVNLDICEQDSIGIVGESGSGKSTMAMAILQLLPKDITEVTGSVVFQGKDLLKLSESELAELRWKDISVVFQKALNALSPVHKIGKQMADVYRVHYPNENKEVIKKRVYEMLELVNLSDRVYDSYPHELSGGMMQRVSIALSLLHNPKLLVLDEATTALDVVTQSQILKEVMELEEKMKLTRIMITHDVSVVASTCKKVAVMYAGCLMEVGNVTDVLLKAKHPYTQGLLKSFPSFKGEKSNLRGIPGSLIDLASVQKGCPFAARCSKATDICFNKKPEIRSFSDTWKVACHKAGEANE